MKREFTGPGRYWHCKDRRSSAHGRRMLLRKRIPLRHTFRLYCALPLGRFGFGFGCRHWHAIQYLADSSQYLFSSYSFPLSGLFPALSLHPRRTTKGPSVARGTQHGSICQAAEDCHPRLSLRRYARPACWYTTSTHGLTLIF